MGFLNIGLKVGPWVALGLMVLLYLGKRDDLAKAIEQCNTDKMESIAAAGVIVQEATVKGYEARIRQMEETALSAVRARDIAIQARLEAESRPERVRTVIQRVANEDACITTPVHPDLLGCLRDNTNCGEARTGSGPNGN